MRKARLSTGILFVGSRERVLRLQEGQQTGRAGISTSSFRHYRTPAVLSRYLHHFSFHESVYDMSKNKGYADPKHDRKKPVNSDILVGSHFLDEGNMFRCIRPEIAQQTDPFLIRIVLLVQKVILISCHIIPTGSTQADGKHSPNHVQPFVCPIHGMV